MGRPAKYPPEFRRDALELVKTSGKSQAQVARDLGINVQTLSGWVTAERDEQARAADPTKLTGDELAELKRLRKENASLKIDREILKKAAAFFAQETMR